jgi:hypothetical protein
MFVFTLYEEALFPGSCFTVVCSYFSTWDNLDLVSEMAENKIIITFGVRSESNRNTAKYHGKLRQSKNQ